MTSDSVMTEAMGLLNQKFIELGDQQRYEIGQPICDGRFIPGQVVLIESGSARLLSDQEGRLSTLSRLDAGSFVGVISLLRGAGCETVRASSAVIARTLSDDKFLALLKEDQRLADLCRQQIWDAGLADLLQSISNRSPKQCSFSKSLLDEF